MQVIYKNKIEEIVSKRTDSMGLLLYVGRISRYLERKYHRRIRNRRNRI